MCTKLTTDVPKADNISGALKKWKREHFGFGLDNLCLLNKLLKDVSNRIASQTNLHLEASVQLKMFEYFVDYIILSNSHLIKPCYIQFVINYANANNMGHNESSIC